MMESNLLRVSGLVYDGLVTGSWFLFPTSKVTHRVGNLMRIPHLRPRISMKELNNKSRNQQVQLACVAIISLQFNP